MLSPAENSNAIVTLDLLPSLWWAFFKKKSDKNIKPFWLSDKHWPNRFFFSQRENIFALNLDPKASMMLQLIAAPVQPVCFCRSCMGRGLE